MPSNNIEGPFPRAGFGNAWGSGTVTDFTISCGWQEQSTLCNLTVVEDPSYGDSFFFQDGEVYVDGGNYVGQPFVFEYEGFYFGGLLKAVDQIDDFSTHPAWRITLVSPVEVLDAAQVILSQYIGPNSDIIFSSSSQSSASFQVSNLLNVYGYAEEGGQAFGRSQITDIGLPWNGDFGIRSILEILTNTPPQEATVSNYGSYINYRGQYYKLDLSTLPTPPSFYYLGGVVNMSLLELLSKFFEDAGCNYIIKLTVNPNGIGPHTIGFIVVPRFIQQQLGLIYPYILGRSDLSSYSHGQELRSDITQMFLVGGALNTLQTFTNSSSSPQNLAIMPFWGFDVQGNPIVGSKPDGSQYADDNYYMSLNGSAIADIMGELGYTDLMYPTNILELRCALGNYDTWLTYIQIFKPAFISKLKIYCVFDPLNPANVQLIIDLMNDTTGFVQNLSNMFTQNHWPAVAQRFYDWIRQQADTYYGKKFLVKLPFQIQIKIDPTTGEVQFNNELTDAGFLPENSSPLGLSFLNENFFLDQTGRFYPFVRFTYQTIYNSIGTISKTVIPDASYLKDTSTVVQYNANATNAYIYSRCEQGEASPVLQDGMISGGSQIFYVNNGFGVVVPAMVVSIPDAIWAQADDITGSLTDLAAMLNIPLITLKNMLDVRSTSFQMQIQPPAFYPDSIAVAIKSNQYLYGPWGKFTANGKLEFEQDDGLVPWEYGGYDLMNQAALAKISNIAMGNQVLERGEFLQAGIPLVSLGDSLVEGGPLITNISASISTSQVTTTYNMQTFVNRAGAFITENAERLKRIGKLYQQLRRTTRQLAFATNDQTSIQQSAYKGFMYGTSYSVEQRTPHGVLGGNLFLNSTGNYQAFAWTQTYQESLANLGLRDSGTFNSTACVGMEALLRPYTNDFTSLYLPGFSPPDPMYFSAAPSGSPASSGTITTLTSTGNFQPIQSGCDFSWLLTGTSYQGLRTSKQPPNYDEARSLALRGPLIINGWGYDLQGNPVPNSGTVGYDDKGAFPLAFGQLQDNNNEFFPNYLQQSIFWPCGPMDIAWDKFRGVWASRGMLLCGTASGDIGASATGSMFLWVNNKPTPELLQVVNFLDSSISDGAKMGATYDPLNGCWRPTIANCSS